MKLIGLAGPARVGKDSVADYLVEQYDFVKFSFSDALYDEVQKAFGMHDQRLLRSAETKEHKTPELALRNCRDRTFYEIAERLIDKAYFDSIGETLIAPWWEPLSPRQVLQWWGTEYRRAQDPDYWIKKSDTFIRVFIEEVAAGRAQANGLVNTSVRFENELAFIDSWQGNVWHIYRREAEAKHLNTYVSEQRLPVRERDKELHNNGNIEKLRTGVSILLTTDTREMILEA